MNRWIVSLLCFLQVFFLLADAQVFNVHIAFGGSPDSMMISWETNSSDPSVVNYGVTNNFGQSATGPSAVSYDINSGWNHQTLITGLSAGTQYFYQCGSDSAWSKTYSFTTEPADQTLPFSIAVYADMGVDNSSENMDRISAKVLNNQIQWAWHGGDISYANDHDYFEATWNEWFSRYEDVVANVPYMVTPGNHEASCNIGTTCYSQTQNFTMYKYKFNMPFESSNAPTSMYYSFDYGMAHFISFSTETDYPGSPGGDQDGDQVEWMKQDLIKANANRDAVPWIFVQGHRPIYSGGDKDHKGDYPTKWAAKIQDAFEDMFNKFKVNIFFCGHVHHYERMHPVYQNETLEPTYQPPQSPVYIINGAGGNMEGLAAFSDDVPDWSAFQYNENYGYGVLDVINSTNVRWNFFDNQDNLIDAIDITNWYLANNDY